ncbi:4Fe-4S dicluster domain-containing protein [Ihubacter massiliensis]|uniref:4Fe-4S dicluster domain-containing protein n=1 Tax=Hominibacterium faecale TaxID=2839743 RepID=A0A9J6QXE7_9FIRM|nr:MULTISPECIES: 4Fe-4S dicluster domain-containing protein [Eubacteriales Family XIII. Incertae Sedis]MCI7303707.1 4Fe-4S dicluster domain-containing protein [Clostridia bacterium]MDE8732208.1 4Fe-4S dicluster domain-containing protein [Eubacteriales bacterium DFI.9.88]MDY3013492.1 4Fe-4S dicluster domain-containing protein [Clostridiales Family XIII bacterium]MCO7122189.1 4Fe-4S dicluster domain-containing protein [Ihubacter massiliensis]MCU7380155.1 4Fe-4S dicluster domain-containing protei
MLGLKNDFKVMPTPEYVYIKVDHDFRSGEAVRAEKGEYVKVGQPIVSYSGRYHSELRSSVSGYIEDYIMYNDYGTMESEYVKIKTDGKQARWEQLQPPEIKDRSDFLRAIASCGIRGIEGITLATCLLIENDELDNLDTLVVNAAEWIEYGNLEQTIIKKDAETIIDMICLTMKCLQLQKCYIGVIENRKDSMACLKWYLKEKELDNIEVVPLQHSYPPGSDRLLVFETVGELLDARMLSTDMGILIANVVSFSALGRYIKEGIPVTHKLITVTDQDRTASRDLLTPLGATIEDIVAYCSEDNEFPKEILLGGYNVAHLLKNYQLPLGRDNMAVFVFDKSPQNGDADVRLECSDCGVCRDNCSADLDPGQIYKTFMANDMEGLKKTGVETCAECGRCAYVCPDKNPLNYIVKIAKEMLAEK